MAYKITQNYIRFGNSRSGQKIHKVRFVVAHDTGNPGSTAHGNRSWFHNSQPLASAHTFIDDKYILEIVPLTEKAWHVQYQKPIDNKMFGADSNDAAIGVELCYGGKINFKEAYSRYIWYMAYLCDKYNLDPRKHIVAHSTLDPGRKTDPDKNSFRIYGITWSGFINDVADELNKIKGELTVSQYNELKKLIDKQNKEIAQLKYELSKKQDQLKSSRTPDPSHKEGWEWYES